MGDTVRGQMPHTINNIQEQTQFRLKRNGFFPAHEKKVEFITNDILHQKNIITLILALLNFIVFRNEVRGTTF